MELEETRENNAPKAEFRITLTAQPDSTGLTPRREYRTVAVGPDGREAYALFINPLEPWMVDAALSSIASAGKTLQRSMPTDSLDPVRDLGTRLYEALFSSSIERAFARTLQVAGEARVRLVLDDEEAMAIPWEFLYDRPRNDFLVLSTRTPLVRSVNRPDPQRASPRLDAPVRVLAVASDVTGAWQVDREIEILRKALGDPQFVELTTRKAVTWADFYQTFMSAQPHVLHLIATGVVSQTTTALRGQAIAFLTEAKTPMRQGEPYSLHGAEELRELAMSNPDLRLLVLNGCKTDGLAAALAGVVTGVIGHRGDITDVGALAFADGLYGALIRGVSLDGAVTAARLRVDSGTPGGREWCAPVLYQQYEGITFPASSQVLAQEMPRLEAKVAPRQDAKASKDDRTLQKLNSLLAIQQTNLDALREHTTRLGAASPTYIQQEIVTTEREIKRLSEEIAAAESASA
jgi:hypothetical protein